MHKYLNNIEELNANIKKINDELSKNEIIKKGLIKKVDSIKKEDINLLKKLAKQIERKRFLTTIKKENKND